MRQVCLQVQVQLVDNKPLNKASVSTTRSSTSDNNTSVSPTGNKASVSTTRGSTSGQQNP